MDRTLRILCERTQPGHDLVGSVLVVFGGYNVLQMPTTQVGQYLDVLGRERDLASQPIVTAKFMELAFGLIQQLQADAVRPFRGRYDMDFGRHERTGALAQCIERFGKYLRCCPCYSK